MKIVESATERTTAATDLIIAVMALRYALALARLRQRDPWKAGLWASTFAALGAGAGLGAVAHGLPLSERAHSWLWRGLYSCLALVVALFALGAARDRWGEPVARRATPAALLSAGGFVLLTQLLPKGFIVFIIYEAAAMIFALAVYGDLARRGALKGASQVVTGIALSIAAAAVQTSPLKLSIFGLRFDNNGLFHLVQIAGLPPLAAGLQAGLES
jgi:hypothetical protein